MSNYMMAVFVEQVTRILDNPIISDVAKTEAIEAMCQGWKAVDIQESRCPMGIQIFTDRALDARDERIHEELQARVTALEEDNVEQERILAAKDERIAEMALLYDSEAARYLSLFNEIKQRLEMAHEVETNQAKVIKTQEKTINHLQKETAALSQTADELSQSLTSHLTFEEEIIMFVRKCVAGSGIRADRPSGAKLMEQARELVKKYDSVPEREAQ